MGKMKSNEASLFVIITLVFAIFLAFVEVVELQSLSFSDPIIKKDLFLLFFIISILIYAQVTNSLSKAFMLFYPILFELDRQFISIADLIPTPQVLKTFSINLIDIFPLALFLIFFDIKKIASYFRFKPVYYYNLYTLIGLLSISWAMNSIAAIAFIPTIILLPVTYYVFMRLFEFSEKNIYYVSLGLLFSALLSIIFVWPTYFGMEWFSFLLSRDSSKTGSTKGSVRAGGIIARAATAILLAGLIPYVYNFGIYYFKKYRKYVHAIGVILILTLVLTLNRMHFAATCLGIGIILLYAVKQKVVKAKIGVVFVCAALFLGTVIYVISLNGNSYEDTLDRSTWNGRLEQYSAAWANFKYSFGMGIGMNNFLVSDISVSMLGAGLGVDNGAFESGNTVHNDFLRVLCEYGVLGFIFYTLFFTSIFKIKSKDNRMQPLIRGAIINIFVIVIIGLSSPALNNNSALILIGIYLAVMKYYSDKPSGEKFISLINKFN